MENELGELNFSFELLDNCPLCSSEIFVPNGKVSWHGMNFWYVFCVNCGLKFMNPRPTGQSYKEFYENFFWQQKLRNLGFKAEGQLWQGQKNFFDNNKKWSLEDGLKNRMAKHRQERAGTIISVLEKYTTINKDSRVLEVGAGFGVTLKQVAEKYACFVYAIEPSTEGLKEMQKDKIIEVLGRWAEDLGGIKEKDIKFNFIIFSNVLENIIDPFVVIRSAKSCLSENGIIYLQTPNLFLFDQMNPYHPFIFSEISLKFLSKKAGFSYEKISEPFDKMLTVILRKDKNIF